MSTATPIVDHVEDLWPAGRRPTETLDQLVLASHLLGAEPRRLELRRRQHLGQGHARSTTRAARSTSCGSRARAPTWRRWAPQHFTGLRLEEMLPLFERDAMSDEEMVAYLARCQLDPAMPRCSIETLLHAFVPAPHVHHTHPDGINVIAGAADGERARRARASATSAAWIHYIRPGFTLSSRSARRSAPTRP